jgi:hypothetical protein
MRAKSARMPTGNSIARFAGRLFYRREKVAGDRMKIDDNAVLLDLAPLGYKD